MRKDEILNMKAGKETDRLITEKVLGLPVEHLPTIYEEGSTEDGKDGWGGFVCPRCKRPSDMLDEPCTKYYSTNISAAWEVVEKLNRIVSVTKFPSGFYECNFVDTVPILSAEADTAPLAICRAALLAVMEFEDA